MTLKMKETLPVLLVDDEEQILKTWKLKLEIGGIRDALTVSDSREVLPLLERQPVAVVVLDLTMPHVSGIDILSALSRDFTHIPVVVVTANDEIDTVVQCMKLGAFDYLTKPVSSGRLVSSVSKALELRSLSKEISSLKHRLLNDSLDRPDAFAAIVTGNKKMRALFQYAEVVAASPMPVIITGETGVGKELVARAVHDISGCRGEFIALNVAGFDDAMFSDALFGHRKGAFTGANHAREGLISRAAGGTLFLDEIGDLKEISQLKLLRLLQDGEYYPGGSDLPRKCDAHIVLATNHDLQKRIAEGKFRNDLYYRLCAHQIQVPPLRDRKDDLPLLLDHFIAKSSRDLGIEAPRYPKELLDLLATYHFPGNVRELQAMVSDAVACSRGKMLSQQPFRRNIAIDQLQPVPAGGSGSDGSGDDTADMQQRIESLFGKFPTLEEAETLLIDTAMAAAKGNQGIAATMLGLKRQTFNMRLKSRRG